MRICVEQGWTSEMSLIILVYMRCVRIDIKDESDDLCAYVCFRHLSCWYIRMDQRREGGFYVIPMDITHEHSGP